MYVANHYNNTYYVYNFQHIRGYVYTVNIEDSLG